MSVQDKMADTLVAMGARIEQLERQLAATEKDAAHTRKMREIRGGMKYGLPCACEFGESDEEVFRACNYHKRMKEELAEARAAMARQAAAVKTLDSARDQELQQLRREKRENWIATQTLDSERAANARLTQELAEAQAEAARWKSAHADMVARNAVLRQRPDLPVDRLPAMRQLAEAQAQAAAMRGALGAVDSEALLTGQLRHELPRQR
jgi:hypothetical protein